jgi:transposase, IS5 family
MHETMNKLLPQIRYWIQTGRVATDKIINLHIPELYSIVRGKVGKPVEFGLNWGIMRLRGGFVLARRAIDRRELVDAKFALRAVEDHIALFGKAPRAYAYDRAGYSAANVSTLKRYGVQDVALAPRGRTPWAVGAKIRDRLVKERARVEGSIGAIKSTRYGFHRPAARSTAMMAASGQRAVLGFNLNKLIREIARRDEWAMAG